MRGLAGTSVRFPSVAPALTPTVACVSSLVRLGSPTQARASNSLRTVGINTSRFPTRPPRRGCSIVLLVTSPETHSLQCSTALQNRSGGEDRPHT